MSKSKNPGLTRRASGLMALEQRFMFDGAAASDITEAVIATASLMPELSEKASGLDASTAPTDLDKTLVVAKGGELLTVMGQTALSSGLEGLQSQLDNLVQREDFQALMAGVFAQSQSPDAQFNDRVMAFKEAVQTGTLSIEVDLLSDAQLQGAQAAYAAEGKGKTQRIYLNADWLNGAPRTDWVAQVLMEELGHALDVYLNGAVDSLGDEGQRFALAAVAPAEQLESILQDRGQDNDTGRLTIDGEEVDVEFAVAPNVSLFFADGYLGTQGSNSNQANNIRTLAALGVTRAAFVQTDVNGDGLFGDGGGTQGNDLAGSLRLYLSNGTTINLNGALNWRETTGSRVEVFGFIFDPGQNASFTYGNNLTYNIVGGSTSNTSSTLGLKAYTSTFSFVNGEDRSGNAATSGLLSALNNYLTASPRPNAINLAANSVLEGQNLVYTVTMSAAPTVTMTYAFGLTGTATTGVDYSTAYVFSNGVTLNSDGTLNVPVGVTSFTVTIPTLVDAVADANETVILTVGGRSATGFIAEPLQVTSLVVNEASPFAVFEITGGANQAVTLALANGITNTASGAGVDYGTAVAANNLEISVNGTTWTPYNNAALLNASGSLKVRTAIVNDAISDNNETFRLVVSPISAAAAALPIYDVAYRPIALSALTRISGTEGAAGAVYRQTNGITIDGQAIDVRVQIVARSNVSTYTNDDNTSNSTRFQPQINSSSSSGSSVDYLFTFFKSGTTEQVSLKNFVINPVDVDGISSTNKEFVELSNISSYQLGSGSLITVKEGSAQGVRDGFLRFEGRSTSLDGITFDNTASFIAYYADPVAEVGIRLGVSGSSSSTRLFSMAIGEALGTFTNPSSTSTSGAVVGTATIVDNGTGTVFDANGNATTNTPDDDRALSVNDIVVNEASPTAVFTVTGASGQTVRLALSGATGNPATDAAGGAAALGTSLPTLQYLEGGVWKNYDASNPPQIATGATTLLVRVAITAEQEQAFDGPEVFALVASNTGGASATGAATIRDDGTGTIYKDDGTADASAVKDDDRPLSVNSFTVNEGSPFAVFTVSGAAGQRATLALTNGTTTGISGLQYFNGSSWVSYTSGTVALDGSGKLLVRTALTPEQEALLDTGETFTLAATNSSGAIAVGTATVRDDGTGDYFADGNTNGTPSLPPGIRLDDDRVLSVNSLTVNEGSPYVVFTVTGATGQAVLLGLAGALGDPATDATGGAAALGTTLPAIEYLEGGVWRVYDAANPPRIPSGATTLLVRVAINSEQEQTLDGPETFRLQASNTGGSTVEGTATIQDNGSGDYFAAGNTSGTSNLPAGTVLDDDRALTVNSLTINEGSPFTVFTVSGAANQLASLSLANGTTTNLTGLQVYSASANAGAGGWIQYTSGTVALDGSGQLLVRTALTPEQETALDTGETFTLTATNTGGSSGVGTATVQDDGTGDFFAGNNNSGSSSLPAGTLLDDDRLLSVSSVTVNEGSPYAVFTVSGAANQTVASLALANQNSDGANLSALQYFDGNTWVAYTSGSVALNGSGQLLVRVALAPEQETAPDGPEGFNLVANNTGGSAAIGLGTIVDDGSGSYFAADNNSANSNVPAGTLLDDDRPLAVSSISVNEASPTAVFTVTGASGQTVRLELSGAVSASADPAGGAAVLGTTAAALPALEYYEGGTWKTYDPANPPKIANNATTLLVRVAITAEQETAADGPETFSLVATNNGGTSATGVATIHDDGTGSIFKNDGTNDPTLVRDDDRALTVGDLTVNEGSPYAVFTVSGAANQLASLSLANGTTTGITGLQVFQNGQWVNYTSGNVALDSAGKLLVRTALSPEQETALDTGETFTLTATNTGLASATGTATVKDDGTGSYFDANNTSGTPALPGGVPLDDDRPLTVNNLSVNEGSPYAVFTVGGAAGQLASLSLTNGTTTGLTGLQVYTTSGWTTYTGGAVALDNSGKLLVRTALAPEQEAALDTGETFTLTASNTGSNGIDGTATGTATVMDDGTGTYFSANNTTGNDDLPANTRLDDDRPLSVDSLTVREDQGPATFTVTGAAGRYVRLEVQSTGSGSGDATVSGSGADVGAQLQYFDGSAWQNYTAGSFVLMPTGGSLQVRVAITRDALVESNETFRLAAFNTGGGSGAGVGTITDFVPALTVVTAVADESGGTLNSFGGLNPSGDLVSDASMSLVSISSPGTGSTVATTPSGNVTLLGLYGTLTFQANGSWSYAVNNANASVEALRLTTNTLVESFSYTVSDSFGAQSSSALNITIRGANDAPVARPDYNTAKESLMADGDPDQYGSADVLGRKAEGSVFPNDSDVDAGDTMTVVNVYGTGRVGTITNSAASSSLVFIAGTTFSPVGNGDEAWYWVDANNNGSKDNGEWRAIFTDASGGTQVTASGSYDGTARTIPLSGSPAYYYDSTGRVQITSINGAIIGFKNSTSITDTTTSSVKFGEVQTNQTSGTSTVSLNSFTGTVAAGMTVSGSGVPSGTKISSVTYNAGGSPTSVVLSGTITSAANATLDFVAAAGASITTQYGTLALAANGGYTYTPFASNTLLSEGESVQEVFKYKIRDAGSLESDSTLTITVLGSGVNDPNAVNDVNSVSEGVDSTAATVVSDNVITNDTTPVIPLSVSAARSSSVAGFTTVTSAGTQITGLYGTLTIASNGSYSYSLNNANAQVQALNDGQSLSEQFQYELINNARALGNNNLLKDYATLTITINGANDSPTLDLDLASAGTGFANTFTEGGAAVALVNAAGASLADVDSVLFNQVTLSFTQSAFADSAEQLQVAGSTLSPLVLNTLGAGSGNFAIGSNNYHYTATLSGGTLTLVFQGNTVASPSTLSTAQAEALLDALRYANTSDNPTGGSARVFNLSVTDAGGRASNLTTSTITVVPVNDAPVLDLDANNSSSATGADFRGSFRVGTAAVPIADIDSAVSDVDSATLASATVILINAKVGDSLSLAASLPAGILATLPAAATADGSLTITFTGVASLADYESALESIRFSATGNNYTSRELTVVVSDGVANSNTATSTLAVLPDDRPLSVAGTTVNEASPYVQFTVTGVDGQRISLDLVATGLGAGHAALGTDTRFAGNGVPLQVLQGGLWQDYTPGSSLTLSGTTLLVRTAVVNDGLYEGAETLQLRAYNDALAEAHGNSTIVDDGTGTLFKDDGTPDNDAVKDDDRVLRVSSVTVNEASPTAVFTVSGAAGQFVSLALADQNSDGADLVTLEYFEGSWKPYTSGTVALDGSGQLQVRVLIAPEQETAVDGPETFRLVATNTGSGAARGLGTIVDDGTGTLFKDDGTPDNTAVKDDDRLLAVNSIVVNEGSTNAVFRVTGAPGQLAMLSLANGTTTGLTGLEVNNGSGWMNYTGAVALDANGLLLVRTALLPEQEPALDNGETFTLTASNTGGTQVLGTATVQDDGSGTLFKDDGSEDQLTLKDDDRPLAVDSPSVNEGSPNVVFTVTGASGQRMTLALAGADGDPLVDLAQGPAALGVALPTLQYLAGGVWQNYDASRPPAIADGATTLLVRVAISAEQEQALDGPETFRLVATNTGGTNAEGTASIRDDGTGSYWISDATAPATVQELLDASLVLDDDRPVTVSSPVVNEASPYAVFTVDGEPGQKVSLDLAAGSATAIADFQSRLEVSADGGQTWTAYAGGLVALDGSGGTLLVRVPLVNDSIQEPDETFTLKATNSGGTATTGTATIQDDGNGTIFKDDGTPDNSAVKDDDRPLQVSSLTVNEGSPYVVFSVTGANGQVARLGLSGSSGDPALDPAGGSAGLGSVAPALQYLEAGSWKTYNASQPPLISGTSLLVRVALAAEQETALDGPETFSLMASNTGGSSAIGTATIVDDGSGNFFAEDNNSASSNVPTGVVLDDDRVLTVNSFTVNEGSPYAVFTVSGAPGQLTTLALANGTSTGLTGLQVHNGSGWVDYSGQAVVLNASGSLLVRTALAPEQESEIDTGETFTLTARNTGGGASTGTATIDDKGQGAYWIGEDTTAALPNQLATAGIVLDDDRSLFIQNITVNEASPYAVFSVQGFFGQFVTLALADGTAGSADYGSALEFSNDGGATWTPYTGNAVALGNDDSLLVRTPVKQDTVFEGSETFTLKATSNSGSQALATATIVDDGSGTLFKDDGTPDNSAVKDDDRPLVVSSVTVNEGSPYAVFTVSGAANQTVASLALANQNSDGANLSDLQYFDGSTWQNYSSASVALNASGQLLVRVALAPEQDTELDGPETFNLVATNTGGSASTGGLGTIKDDGTGDYFAADNNTATPAVPSGVVLDDDNPKPAALPPVPAVPTAPAAPPAVLVAPLPVVVSQQSFASALSPLTQTLVRAEPPMAMPDAVTSGSGYQIPVSESAPVGLNLYQGVTDQFIQSTNLTTRISLPFDAFIHSSKDAVIRLQAKQADDSNLPSWVQFDPATGVFTVTPPANFKGKLDLKVLARDDDGREAVAMFQMFIGEQTAPQVQSRDSFSEKLKMAGKRQITLVRVADGAHKAPVREAAPAREAAAVRESAPVRVRAG